MPSQHNVQTTLREAVSSNNPHSIATALTYRYPQPLSGGGGDSGRSTTPTNNIRKQSLFDSNGTDWGPLLTSLLQIHQNIATSSSAVECYKYQSALHSSLNHIFSSTPGNVLVPALHITCRNTQQCAILADYESCGGGGGGGRRNDHKHLSSAVTLLQESFSKTLNDRKEMDSHGQVVKYSEDGSKKVGVLRIVNLLFAMYFRLNTLRLCKNLLRPVESRNLHEKGAMGDKVTYRYYVGRLHMFEDQYDKAESNLQYALKHCHKSAISNKKRILNYLIPVKLVRGRLPTNALLQKYNLMEEFGRLVKGIRTGDLKTFNSSLMEKQSLFIRRGTYLLLEKCKVICYRNLFKRVFTIAGKHQLHLGNLAKSFKWLGRNTSGDSSSGLDEVDMDLDEIECILANLIFRGYVRGYISHSKRILVLSKKDPFPTSAIVK